MESDPRKTLPCADGPVVALLGCFKTFEVLALPKLGQHPKVHGEYITNHENIFLGFIVLKRPCWRCQSIKRIRISF